MADGNRSALPTLESIFQEKQSQRRERARASLRTALDAVQGRLAVDNKAPADHVECARLLQSLGREDEALAALVNGIAVCGFEETLYRRTIDRLIWNHRIEQVEVLAEEACRRHPDNFGFHLTRALMLPVFYESLDEVENWRRRFERGLEGIVGRAIWATTEGQHSALRAISKHSNELLAYQGRDDRGLQEQYGEMVHRIVTANFPQWSRPVSPRICSNFRRIRVGFVSARFFSTSASKLFVGWLRGLDRRRFDIFAYHAGRSVDATTAEVKRLAGSNYRYFGRVLNDAVAAISADELDILIYLDVGMAPIMMQLASLYLAPVQCVAWDHPMTSGLRTLDYFFSSDLMEPSGAENSYTEDLVRLPGIGVNVPKPVIPRILLAKTRRDLGLREDAVIYLCCQNWPKYLPGNDGVYAEIAASVSKAQFAFLSPSKAAGEALMARLELEFARRGLRAADHCVLLPTTSEFEFWNRYLNADVFLDTFEWSGGVSTLEAVACGLPVVTLPGPFLRSRHSFAILTQLGVSETVAQDREDYIRIAIRLGLDREWHSGIVNRMRSSFHRLYGDDRSSVALGRFLEVAEPSARVRY